MDLPWAGQTAQADAARTGFPRHQMDRYGTPPRRRMDLPWAGQTAQADAARTGFPRHQMDGYGTPPRRLNGLTLGLPG